MKIFQTMRVNLSGHMVLWILLDRSTMVFGQQFPVTFIGTITENGSDIRVPRASF